MNAIWQAFLNSLKGIAFGLRTERAIRQEAIVLVVALPLCFAVGASGWQRVLLLVTLLLVLAVEFLNTGLEKLCDHVTPERHPRIAAIKDMGSSACLCVQLAAGLIWLFALSERLGWL